MRKRYGEEIKEYILENVDDCPAGISKLASEKFQVSRNAVAKHLQSLVREGKLRAEGKTKARKYFLLPAIDEIFSFNVDEYLQEDVVWRKSISPLLKDLPKNIFEICQFGITEMLNNVIDHSESPTALVSVVRDWKNVELMVKDDGIGIFQKIQNDCNLDDPRQALLELSKGKLTTDSTKHTGEGIFFTSRMFTKFSISSGALFFCRTREDDEWLIETKEQELKKGTCIIMAIDNKASHTPNDIFNKYMSELNNFGFTKTHVPLELLRYEGENLISRSQAKRLMARIESFKEAMLDFKGINTIGQAFADEIFRVWASNHPQTKILIANANDEVEKMVNRVTGKVEISL